MIPTNKEFYYHPYYFFLKEMKDNYSLYFSSEENIMEARKKDEFIKIPKEKIKTLKKYLEKLINGKEIKTTKKLKGEIEELVNMDGNLSNSSIPILDPRVHPKKTMDQTVAAARITNDPITRGYGTYYGESVDEIKESDISGAFGYQETKDLDGKETYKYFVKKMDMNPDDAKERTKEQGKDPSGKRDEKSKYRFKKVKTKSGKIKKVKDPNFISRQILPEIQKQKMIKVLEDILVNKKNNNSEISEKEPKISNIVKKNLKTLKKQAEKEGLSLSELIKLLKSE